MSSSPISNLTNGYLQSILGNALQNSGLTSKTSAPPATQQPDHTQLSPVAQLLSTLQQLQQTDPSKYQQVTQQIATDLQSAAQTAQSDGNTTAANQLNQLATDFASASKSGQLPNVQDLAKAAGGHHRHHHHAAASADPDGNSGASSSSSSASQTLSQFLAALQANGAQSDSFNPVSIISKTLSDAGLGNSNG